jgi:glycosyltransferase involved in cell wall biosynthesis
VRVFYGHDDVPSPGEPVAGGTAKFQKLAARFPNEPVRFSVLYLGSSWLPRDLDPLLRLAARRSIPVVVNQNGVGYPGWAGAETEEVNRPIARALQAADHVLYQSSFCKESADLFAAPARGTWEVLPNAVDVGVFTPAVPPPPGGPVILLGGDQTQPYRVELALRTLVEVRRVLPDARLLVTGRLVVDPRPLVAELGLVSAVDLVGSYSQRDAPALFRRAHLLLHPKVNDPCPTVVLEAMACGLPVIHPESGGLPEIVVRGAGKGVPHETGYERDSPPSPEAFAAAVLEVVDRLPEHAAAARLRAVEHYALGPWLDRHAALFATLAG